MTEFCREFNRNRIIGHEMSLCKTTVPIEFGITSSENLYMEFQEDVQKDSILRNNGSPLIPTRVSSTVLGSSMVMILLLVFILVDVD